MSDDNGLDDILSEVQKLFAAAYQRGFGDGGAAMRANILAAASLPMAVTNGTIGVVGEVAPRPVTSADFGFEDPKRREISARAPRGLVPTFIRERLSETPGMTERQLMDAAAALEPQIATKSIGNQLRRFLGTLYERDAKRRWYLLGQMKSANESPTTAFAELFTSNRKEVGQQ